MAEQSDILDSGENVPERKIVVTLNDGAQRIFIVKDNTVTINYLTTVSKKADTLSYLDHPTKLKTIIEPKKNAAGEYCVKIPAHIKHFSIEESEESK